MRQHRPQHPRHPERGQQPHGAKKFKSETDDVLTEHLPKVRHAGRMSWCSAPLLSTLSEWTEGCNPIRVSAIQSNLDAAREHLVESLCRSYLTALRVLGDADQAEALVRQAIETLDPGDVKSNSLRNATIRLLVQKQIDAISH
jgi:hypothetical protein